MYIKLELKQYLEELVKRGLILFLFLTLMMSLSAKNQFDMQKMTQDWNQLHPGMLPHWMTPDEAAGINQNTRIFQETNPPVAPVRAVAEFEQSTGALIRWPLGIPYTLIAELSQDVKVITIVASTSQQNQAITAYQSNGVYMENCSFMIAPTDSYWTRDFGPWFVFDGNNQLGLVDFVYNRPRPNDDELPRTFASMNDIPLYGMNLQETGGNFMTDGYHTASQTKITYTENGDNQTNVNQKMRDYMGIENFYVLDDPNNTYIDHIDCWGKFLAPDKVLIRSVPTSHPQYSAIEATANYYTTHNCGYGYPFQVYRVSTPEDQPYTNSLILNNKVFVPQISDIADDPALQAYKNALPGYEVIGFMAASSTPWESTDALHCRVHEIIDKDMLFIDHLPLHGAYLYGHPISLSVNFIAHSGMRLYSDSLKIYYKINNGSFQSLNLVQNESNPSLCEVTLPIIPPGSQVQYYIHGADESGHSANVPRMGVFDPFRFSISSDSLAPVIDISPIPNITLAAFPYQTIAHVTDNSGIDQVNLVYGIDTTVLSYSLNPVSVNNRDYSFEIPIDNINAGDTVYYQVNASDISIPANSSSSRCRHFTVVPATNNDDQSAIFTHDIFLGVYPNPALLRHMSDSNTVSLKYRSVTTHSVIFKIYNIKGQLVRSLSGQGGKQGVFISSWNCQDSDGKKIKSGIYLINMQSGSQVQTRKLVFIE